MHLYVLGAAVQRQLFSLNKRQPDTGNT